MHLTGSGDGRAGVQGSHKSGAILSLQIMDPQGSPAGGEPYCLPCNLGTPRWAWVGPRRAGSSADYTIPWFVPWSQADHPGSCSNLCLAPSPQPSLTTAGLREGALTADTVTIYPSSLTRRYLYWVCTSGCKRW